MGKTTKTTQPHDFLELSAGQFEDLVRQLAATSGINWSRAPEPVGRLGSDRGRDIRLTEHHQLDGLEIEREWLIQVKRWKKISAAELIRIVRKAVPDPNKAPYAFVVALACRTTTVAFEAFESEAFKCGIAHSELWTSDTLNDKLLLDGNSRLAAYYFGDGPAVDGTVPIPLALDRSLGRDLRLIGREDELARLQAAAGDVILLGRPGTGKSRLATEADGARFVTSQATADTVAASLREHRPSHVVVDDAGLALDQVEMLLELRRAGHGFSVVATAWPEHREEVLRLLPDAVLIELPLLDRVTIDELLVTLGITNPYARSEILDQAHGRVGWAIVLADLIKHGRGLEVVTGRALIAQIEPYLKRMGAASDHVFGFLSIMAALGEVNDGELSEVGRLLELGPIERQRILREGAAIGVLEPHRGSLRIVPDALRSAMVLHSFFDHLPGLMPINDLLVRWPGHRRSILAAIIEAAGNGSPEARREIEQNIRAVFDEDLDLIKQYVALDEAAASAAIASLEQRSNLAWHRLEILTVAAKRFALPQAVQGLLDLAVGDERPQHANPSHPLRVLGEVGSRIIPFGGTSFDARQRILVAASEWFDADQSPERQLVWADLVPQLLDPAVAGNYTDPGSPMKVNLQAGFESPDHLRSIADELWPIVAVRLDRLGTEAMVKMIHLAEQWIRLWRRFEGPFGVKPSELAGETARTFLATLLPALAAACDEKPAALVSLREITQRLGATVRLKVDPEFRLLSWQPWHLPGRGKSGLFSRTVGRLADQWSAEDPDVLMIRLAGWITQARYRQQTLHPMIAFAFQALADRAPDIDALVLAGLRADINWELEPLFKASLDRHSDAPSWLLSAFTGPARGAALASALLAGPNRTATEAAISELGRQDHLLVEQAVSGRRDGPDWVCLALLRHPVPLIRSTAALQFGLKETDHEPMLPDDWYQDWADAFSSASLPLPSEHGKYMLGLQLKRLVVRDPDLVETWLSSQMATESSLRVYDLPDDAVASLSGLPRMSRDKLIRAAGRHSWSAELLNDLVGDDRVWLTELLEGGVIDVSDILSTFYNTRDFGDDDTQAAKRVTRVLLLAPVLVPRGVPLLTLAATAEPTGRVGDESAHYERTRAAFDSANASTGAAEAVRQEGLSYFAMKRDEALTEERAQRISGDL